jgi:hypothetical protein
VSSQRVVVALDLNAPARHYGVRYSLFIGAPTR